MTKKVVTKDIVRKCWLRWELGAHANYNYERLQSSGFLFAIAPVLKVLYGDDKEEMKAAMKRHLEFYNTQPHYGNIIQGLVIAMETERANGAPITGEAISSIKTGLMGPLAGIGDTLWNSALMSILLAIGVSLAEGGNIIGPLFWIIMDIGIMVPVGYICYIKSWEVGTKGVDKFLNSGVMQKVIQGAKIMGAITIGAVSASYVTMSTPLALAAGNGVFSIQESLFDAIFVGILPLALTFFIYWLLSKKKLSNLQAMGVIILIGIIGGGLGLLS